MIALARRLLAALLPADVRHALIHDLDLEYARVIRPARGRIPAALWYWRQVAGSLAPAIGMRFRRGRLAADAARDLRFGLRLLARTRGFTVSVVGTLALGIGATSAMVSLVDGILIKPLPYRDPAGLVRIWSSNPRGIPRAAIAPADYFDWTEQASGFASMAAFTSDQVTMTGLGDPVRLPSATVTPNLGETLGVQPLLGRWFSPDDAQRAVILIGESLWRERFGADPAVLGRTLALDSQSYVIVGVMPRTFQFPSREIRLWLPLAAEWRSQPRNAHFLGVVARLRDGAHSEAAVEDLRRVARGLEQTYPTTNRGWGVTVASLDSSIVGNVRVPLLGLLAAVACVLLIACANVASLMLARGVGRSREFAVRAALGASRSRLVRQQLVESAAIASLGGAAGLALASWALAAVRGLRGIELPLLDRAAIDGRAIVATLGLTAVSAVIAGSLPAWRSARARAGETLGGGTRSTAQGVRVRRAIVFAQVALSTLLVAAGLLLLKSFVRLSSVPTGFAADRTLLADVTLPSSRYRRDARAAVFDRALERLRAAPGVQAAAAGGPMPLSGQDGLLRFGVAIEGRTIPADRPDRVYLRWATTGYFSAMGIEQRAGRPFVSSDVASSTPVAVIDEAFARRFFEADDPVGRRIQVSNERGTWRQVVGVVGSVRQTSLDRSADPHVYLPELQSPSPALTFVVRGPQDPAIALSSLRDAIRAVDPELPLANVRTLAGLVEESVGARRTNAVALTLFAALALALTLVGVYGAVAQAVAQSTREMGVRLALGAAAGEVIRLVVRRAAGLAAGGVLAGAIAAWLLAPGLQGLLYGVDPRDLPSLLAAGGLLIGAASLAAFLPARRLLRLDVVNALRVE